MIKKYFVRIRTLMPASSGELFICHDHYFIPADGLATTLHGSTFHINSPVEQPTANSLAKYGRHCMQDTPRCCLNFKTGDIPSPEIPFPEGT